jgi:cell division protein FtsI (penicillin-binding protein 3)
MKSSNKQTVFAKRFYIVIALFMLVVAVLFYRMLELTLFDQSFLESQGKSRSIRLVKTPAFRGMITDRNGEPLAISTPVDSVWLNPKYIESDEEERGQLSRLLGLSSHYVAQQISAHRKKSFLYLKRNITPNVAAQVNALAIPGVHTQRSYKRYYPEAEVTSQLIGFTNVDDQGQEGLELAYNNWLTGVAGKAIVVKDLLGDVVAELDVKQKQRPGNDLTLSIDRRIQFIAYQALKEAVDEFDAASGSAVVMNVKTGEILAMVNAPSFNPNERNKQFSSAFKNKAVTDVFEPGSTIKAFSIVSALDSGEFVPDTEIETAPGYFKVDKNWVRDELNNKTLNVTQILQKSSNVGIAKMTLALPGDQLWSVLNRVGFGLRTQSSFPGEASGSLIHQNPWRPFTLATLAFGYGLSVTTLQLANAYAIVANEGKKVPVTLIKRETPAPSEQVLDKKAAKETVTMLESVVAPGGTGMRASVLGYRVAGKTGTAKMAGPNGYYAHRYVGSFVGFAPVSDPEIVVAVVVFEPKGRSYFGGLVAAPAFSKMMAGTLRILNIAPDQIATAA